MPKHIDSFTTAHLSIELLRRIPRNRKVTSSELHQQLCSAGIVRTKRSIQRTLDKLTEQYDIECDMQSKPYGYRWKEKAKGLNLLSLTPQESLLLMLAKEQLSYLLPPSLFRSMASFFEQAQRTLDPYTGSIQEREWLSKVRVVSTSQPLLPPKINPDVFESISTALYENRWLEAEYTNAEERCASIEVMPLGLAQQGTRLYLVCRYRGFDNERSLALHRFVSARVMDETFKRPKDFDLKKYDDDGRFGFGEGKRIRLTFSINKDYGLHLLESPLSSDQQVTTHESHYEIQATVVDSAMLDWWLRGFGKAVFNVEKHPI